MWPFLPSGTRKLATSFSQIANQDAEASLQLFTRQIYPQSIYHLQQAVEKACKAYGLLAGTLQPTSRDLIRSVSHRSLLGMMLRVPEMMERLPALREAIRKSVNQAKLKQIGVWEILERYLQKQGSEDPIEAKRAINQVKALDASKLWRISLELAPNHPFTKTIWQRLNEADKRNAEADEVERIIPESLKAFLSHPEDLDFALNLFGRAGPELFPLTLVSMWHEKETRYPPIAKEDYWNPEEYTSDKGLITNYKLFYSHTDRLCRAIKTASRAAERHVGL
jgi:HEPN domain-containing protein